MSGDQARPAWTVAVDVSGDLVLMTVRASGATLRPTMSSAEARNLAAMLLRGAEVADTAGKPHGHA